MEFCGHHTENIDLESHNTQLDNGSDTNSGDLPYEDDVDDEDFTSPVDTQQSIENNLIGTTFDLAVLPMFKNCAVDGVGLLDVGSFKHSRSHSDCTGIPQTIADIKVNSFHGLQQETKDSERKMEPKTLSPADGASDHNSDVVEKVDLSNLDRINAKIINTAIHCEGQYAVYAIQVSVVEENQQKCWHVYRRYSRFLELKKTLVKRVRHSGYVSVKRRLTIKPFSTPQCLGFHSRRRRLSKILNDRYSNTEWLC